MTMLSTALLTLALAQSAPGVVDAGVLRDRLLLLTDGQKHYVAVDPANPLGVDLFSSGDGTLFARVPVIGGGSTGTEQWSVAIWDPRVRHGGNALASVDMRESGKRYSVSCARKDTALTPVPAEEAKVVFAAATFVEPTWTRQPEKLLRDETGVYYLVDRFRSKDPSDRRDFRVFVGRKGAMKQLPLKDIVDDNQGMILETKTGDLRLVTSAEGKLEGKWLQGKRSTTLLEVDLSRFDTGRMIYMDLGPYSSQRLGTPCDDFM